MEAWLGFGTLPHSGTKQVKFEGMWWGEDFFSLKSVV